MTLNGTNLAVDTSAVDTVLFQGNGGSDSASLAGRPGGGNTLSLSPGGGSLSGPGYAVQLQGVDTITATGGPGDVAYLHDAPGNDSFVGTPSYAYLDGPGFYDQASGFATVLGISSAGHDTAYLQDPT